MDPRILRMGEEQESGEREGRVSDFPVLFKQDSFVAFIYFIYWISLESSINHYHYPLPPKAQDPFFQPKRIKPNI